MTPSLTGVLTTKPLLNSPDDVFLCVCVLYRYSVLCSVLI